MHRLPIGKVSPPPLSLRHQVNSSNSVKYYAVNVFLWGAIQMVMASCHNFAGMAGKSQFILLKTRTLANSMQ